VPYDAATAAGFAHYWRLLPERGTRGALPCDVLMGGGFLTHRIKASIKGTKVCVLVCFCLFVCSEAPFDFSRHHTQAPPDQTTAA
jgi:hypothetical protein